MVVKETELFLKLSKQESQTRPYSGPFYHSAPGLSIKTQAQPCARADRLTERPGRCIPHLEERCIETVNQMLEFGKLSCGVRSCVAILLLGSSVYAAGGADPRIAD